MIIAFSSSSINSQLKPQFRIYRFLIFYTVCLRLTISRSLFIALKNHRVEKSIRKMILFSTWHLQIQLTRKQLAEIVTVTRVAIRSYTEDDCTRLKGQYNHCAIYFVSSTRFISILFAHRTIVSVPMYRK